MGQQPEALYAWATLQEWRVIYIPAIAVTVCGILITTLLRRWKDYNTANEARAKARTAKAASYKARAEAIEAGQRICNGCRNGINVVADCPFFGAFAPLGAPRAPHGF